MARRPRIPRELTKKPFTLEEARRAGLTLDALRGKAWRRLGAELYCWKGMRSDPWRLLSAWRDVLPAEAVFAGTTAAWILGLDFDPTTPVQVVVPPESGLRSRAGLGVRRCEIGSKEIVKVRGLPATALHRTLTDLCARLPAQDALVALDMAVHARLTDVVTLRRHADAVKGRNGTRGLQALVALAAPAESPMETRLRWLLIQAGLPRPEVQRDLHDPDGRFVGRADLYYRSARLVLEYDGGNHRDRLVADDRRQNALISAGYQILRFTAPDLHQPHLVEAQVRAALVTPVWHQKRAS